MVRGQNCKQTCLVKTEQTTKINLKIQYNPITYHRQIQIVQEVHEFKDVVDPFCLKLL